MRQCCHTRPISPGRGVSPARLDRPAGAPPDKQMGDVRSEARSEGRSEAQHIARLTPLAEVLAAIDRMVAAVPPYSAGGDSALGTTLAADVILPQASPAAALALRDGWAVRAEQTFDAGSYAAAPLVTPPVEVAVGQR